MEMQYKYWNGYDLFITIISESCQAADDRLYREYGALTFWKFKLFTITKTPTQ